MAADVVRWLALETLRRTMPAGVAVIELRSDWPEGRVLCRQSMAGARYGDRLVGLVVEDWLLAVPPEDAVKELIDRVYALVNPHAVGM